MLSLLLLTAALGGISCTRGAELRGNPNGSPSGDEPLKVQLNRGYELFDDLVKALNIRNESVFGPQHRDEKGNLIPKHIQITSVVQVDICEGEQASEVYSYPAGTTWTGWVYPGYAYNYNLDTSSEVLDSYCLFFQARVGDFNVNFDTIEGKAIESLKQFGAAFCEDCYAYIGATISVRAIANSYGVTISFSAGGGIQYNAVVGLGVPAINVPLDQPVMNELFSTDVFDLFSLSGISLSGRAALVAGYSGYLNASGSISVTTHFSASASMVFGIEDGVYTQGFDAPVRLDAPTIRQNQFELHEAAEFNIFVTPAMYWTLTYTYLGCGVGATFKTPFSGAYSFYESASGDRCETALEIQSNVGLVNYGYEVLYIPWYYDADFQSQPFTVYFDNNEHICLMSETYEDDPTINWPPLSSTL